MASSSDSKKRKIEQENRIFKEEWTHEFFFILPDHLNSKPLCLICGENVSVPKSYNLNRHFKKNHNTFNQNYPKGSEIRKKKIAALQNNYHRSRNVLKQSTSEQEKATEASHRISWILGKRMVPFSHSEIVKECLIEAAKAIFDDKKVAEEFEKIPLSNNTNTRRTEINAGTVLDQLLFDLKSSESFSIAVDESTDITDTAQMAVFVRFPNKQKCEFSEELLTLLPLHDRTTGEQLFDTFDDFMTKHGISYENLTSVVTDGAPSMVGREKGFVRFVQKKNRSVLAFHCIIHSSVLCAKLNNSFAQIMTKVMKLINYLRSKSALQHRQLKAFLQESCSEYEDLLLHNEVRWLSKGKALDRVWLLKAEIQTFLATRNGVAAADFSQFLSDETAMKSVVFLCDLFEHLNVFNLRLQVRGVSISHLMETVRSFSLKLDLFQNDIDSNELLHFSKLKKFLSVLVEDDGDITGFSAFLQQVRNEFSERFHELSSIEDVLIMCRNPFSVEPNGKWCKQVNKFTGVNRGAIQLELIDLQADSTLKEVFKSETSETFWLKYVPSAKFPELKKLGITLCSIFGSTYLCEAAFSRVNFIKNRFRGNLTDTHLEHCLRIAVTNYQPNFKELTLSRRCNFSH